MYLLICLMLRVLFTIAWVLYFIIIIICIRWQYSNNSESVFSYIIIIWICTPLDNVSCTKSSAEDVGELLIDINAIVGIFCMVVLFRKAFHYLIYYRNWQYVFFTFFYTIIGKGDFFFICLIVYSRTSNWLINYLLFYIQLKNFLLIYEDVTITGEGLSKFRPMLGAQGLWTGRDLYRARPAVTRDLGFTGSSEGPPHSVASYDTQGDVEDLF
jgi:hypothetical protein